ncbi:Tat pathway signal protein [Brevundimonas sp.]|uniref:Tat pathway signal protein n=1 Tax=Brevundimonas sp. TaxID=1871086 RepID=UPI0035B3E3AF
MSRHPDPTPADTSPTPADHQQMDRSNDPEVTRAMDEAAPEAAMHSRRQRLAGSAAGVGSVGYDEAGAFDVGAGEEPGGREPGSRGGG